MKFKVLLLCVLFSYNVRAQLSTGGRPKSFSLKTKSDVIIENLQVAAIDTLQLQQYDKTTGIDNRFSVGNDVSIDLKTVATRTILPQGGTIWQYAISGEGSVGIAVHFSHFWLPEGAELYLYDSTHTIIRGAYTNRNNHEDGYLAISDIPSTQVILEYYEPEGCQKEGLLTIGSIYQSYKTLASTTADRIFINCPDGDNWQNEKHAVARMTYHSGRYGYYCTGFLVNNVKQDGTPYFQTANHCISDSASARTLIACFNYEYATCNGGQIRDSLSLSGARLLAHSSVSDFSLLLLSETPPNSAKPYYAGWDASARSPKSGVGIHHPQGTPKCISTESDPPRNQKIAIQWDEGVTSNANTHWQVQFNKGGTEAGSSGSPLFDDNHRVIGQLHGGDEYTSYYGKLSLSWNYNSYKSLQLAAWLDPNKTNTRVLDGAYIGVKPSANFYSKITTTCLNNTITFSDSSKNVPRAWKWEITPSTFSYQNKTSDTSQNPQVKFLANGNYTIKLTVTNENGTDSIQKNNYISVGDHIEIKIKGIPANDTICGCDLTEYALAVWGAEKFTFSLDRRDKLNYSITTDSIYLFLKSEKKKEGSFDTWITASGSQGTCTAKDSVLLHVIQPKNDDVANATSLLLGRNSGFSNRCATTEENEPKDNPSIILADTTIHNTVWFTFYSPKSGPFSIESNGIAQKMTLFKAESAADILSGNTELCTQIQATTNANDPNTPAHIFDVAPQNGIRYWLQMDGFKGEEGEFYIDLLASDIIVYPNPATNAATLLIGNKETGDAKIRLINITGAVVWENRMAITPENNRYLLDFTTVASGMYVFEVELQGSVQKTKFIIAKNQ